MTRRDGSFTFGPNSQAASSRRGWIFLVVLLAIGGLGAYWYFNPAAQPALIAEYMPTDPAAEVNMYRWKDANGQWVVSDQPPPEGVEYEVVSYRHDTNVRPATKSDED